MATGKDMLEFIIDQLRDLDDIRTRPMMGEYVVYYQDKVIGLICDNQLFIKETKAGRELLGSVHEESPYEGAKKMFVVDIENRKLLCEVIEASYPELPLPKPKKKKRV